MKTGTGIFLVLASAAGAALGAALSRRRSPALRALAIGAGFAAPWGLRAAFAQEEPTCSVLFITDTHGAAVANAALVRAMLREDGISRVLHAGDVVDRVSDWPIWWDAPFREVMAKWPVSAASGNHDSEDAYAGFVARFGEEPHAVVCGNAEFFLVPWGTARRTANWLRDRVQASTARWKVLVSHRPLWGTDGSVLLADLFAESLPHIDLVLSGHEHVAWDSVHDVGGHPVRQIIDVSGPKMYACPPEAQGCVENESAYWRLDFLPNEIRATRKVAARR